MRGLVVTQRAPNPDGVLNALNLYEADAPAPKLHYSEGDSLSAEDCFTGCLAFDAWIGNSDRHHENWGIVAHIDVGGPERRTLAPSYDHAASLGQTLPDRKRIDRMETNDPEYAVAAWAVKARSHLYIDGADEKPAFTREAFLCAAKRQQKAARFWRERIVNVNTAVVAEVVTAIPENWMSESARQFAIRMLDVNRDAFQEIALP